MIHGILFAGLEHHRADVACAEASVGSLVAGVHVREYVLFRGGDMAAFVARIETAAVLHAGDVRVRELGIELELLVGHFDIA